MKQVLLTLATLARALPGPAMASPQAFQALRQFCYAARLLNAQGWSVAPGSAMGEHIRQEAGMTADNYRVAFLIARDYNHPACTGIR